MLNEYLLIPIVKFLSLQLYIVYAGKVEFNIEFKNIQPHQYLLVFAFKFTHSFFSDFKWLLFWELNF